ncbi:unnamed protein product [Spirodela intermedia]|uniref:Protein kinase domain-containing protein n=1 Tax=Spirodela intermedia TaxID=51605 RepID=A0A7I8IG85_SPIIN|nr:unnamed protein product [Spirodela intermedia]CAA6656902.1 unnamed protein product [Spirodela intermedia]
MAAAMECWSGRPSTDEDMVEQVLMKNQDRSEAYPSTEPEPTGPQPRRCHRRPEELPQPRSGGEGEGLVGSIVRNLTQLYPGSQLPEKVIADIRRHYECLPSSYAQAEHDIKEVLLHSRLIEQAAAEDHPAVHGKGTTTLFKLTFVSHSPISWPAIADSLDASSMLCKKVQIFEKKGLTLGIALLLVHSVSDKAFKTRAEAALRSAVKKPAPRSGGGAVKLSFGLCGCKDREAAGVREDDSEFTGGGGEWRRPERISSFVVAVDERQALRLGAGEMGRWLLSPEEVEIADRTGPNSFTGTCRGRKVWIKKLRGCERGTAYEVQLRRDLLELMSSGHPNVLHLHGLCVDETHGLCLVTKAMDGGSVHDLLQSRRKRIPTGELMRIAAGVAEGLRFVNDHGVCFRDLNTQRILLDKQGNSCLGDMGVVSVCKSTGEVADYETAGYRWLAPETWMSNVYSFGMVLWEMVTGEAAYSSYSPVQAAVGIAACGLRPEIPRDCPPVLRSLMVKCWNSSPSRRPPFSEILTILSSQATR